MSGFIGVVCGLQDEAATLPQDDRLRVFCAAGSGQRAYRAALDFADAGAAILVSYGAAAGLAPDIVAGAVVCADPLHLPHREGLRLGDITAVDAPLATPEAKAALFAATEALAADMETGGVVQAADECGLPLIRLRAISDDAHTTAPAIAMAGMREDGSTAAWPVVRGLARRPQDLPALLRLARGYGRALSGLRRFGPRLLSALG